LTSRLTEAEIERAFLGAAVKRSEFLRLRQTKKANREYDKLHKLLKHRIRALPDRGEALLKRVAAHPSFDVQINAAAGLLAIDEAYAIRLLEEVCRRASGLTSFTAELTLRQWRAGSIRAYLS
jgi:hypothetical protein